ncbi:MAG: hypothetical protein IKE64_12335, partial [Thermoguttaceae bacterium]|nr:hypothetical protein [Thermoguttaceae bacterium]
MAFDFTGISNQNEFFTEYYLASVFEGDCKEVLDAWAKLGDKTPYEALGGLRREFLRLDEAVKKTRGAEAIFAQTAPFTRHLLAVLGYSTQNLDCPFLKETEHGDVPIIGEATRDGDPYLWIIEAASTPGEITDPLGQTLLEGQYPEGTDPARRFLDKTIEELIHGEIFSLKRPPRWVMVVRYDTVILIDRGKYNDKRLLRFDTREILDRQEKSTLKVTAILLHKDSLCPESGSPRLDTFDENSYRHAAGVTEDLKYAAREAVELMGNEAVWYLRKSHKGVFNDENLAEKLTVESLRYLYRLLFLFYLEARAGKLGYIPMNSDVYRAGYSFESLRDLEMTPLTTPRSRDGYFFDESVKTLFRLIAGGYNTQSVTGALSDSGKRLIHHDFVLDKLECNLFDPGRTPLLRSVKFRNHVWQKIIRLLSLTKEVKGKKRHRGRVSYAQLGIIQLGAVYEGLLSYRGFFAKTDLYEVKRAEDKWDPLQQGYFVTEEELAGYDEQERVTDEKGDFVKHEKGKFLYRQAGRDREKSASYYTPHSLTKCLVKYALKELIGEKPGDEHYKTADEILNLTVSEPAMGSAAFLNEAVNQLADAYLRRKQQETNRLIPGERIEEETQKVRMFLADRNIFGVDLNPVAVELGEISLWLNSIYSADFIPWFGGQLVCGNSLIGARRQVYPASSLTVKEKNHLWFHSPPKRVMPGQQRPEGSVYHFLVPDPGMALYQDKVIKGMKKDQIQKIEAWRKDFTKPFSRDDSVLLRRLSDAVDRLWRQHTDELHKFREETTDELSIFGHDDKKRKNVPLREKEQRLNELNTKRREASTPFRRLKMIMDYWCALWFWPIDRAGDLPDR